MAQLSWSESRGQACSNNARDGEVDTRGDVCVRTLVKSERGRTLDGRAMREEGSSQKALKTMEDIASHGVGKTSSDALDDLSPNGVKEIHVLKSRFGRLDANPLLARAIVRDAYERVLLHVVRYRRVGTLRLDPREYVRGDCSGLRSRGQMHEVIALIVFPILGLENQNRVVLEINLGLRALWEGKRGTRHVVNSP